MSLLCLVHSALEQVGLCGVLHVIIMAHVSITFDHNDNKEEEEWYNIKKNCLIGRTPSMCVCVTIRFHNNVQNIHICMTYLER